MRQRSRLLLATPEIAGFFQAIGMGFGRGDDTSLGVVFVRFEHWKDRTRKQQDVVAELFPRFLGGIRAFQSGPRSQRPLQASIQASSQTLS